MTLVDDLAQVRQDPRDLLRLGRLANLHAVDDERKDEFPAALRGQVTREGLAGNEKAAVRLVLPQESSRLGPHFASHGALRGNSLRERAVDSQNRQCLFISGKIAA